MVKAAADKGGERAGSTRARSGMTTATHILFTLLPEAVPASRASGRQQNEHGRHQHSRRRCDGLRRPRSRSDGRGAEILQTQRLLLHPRSGRRRRDGMAAGSSLKKYLRAVREKSRTCPRQDRRSTARIRARWSTRRPANGGSFIFRTRARTAASFTCSPRRWKNGFPVIGDDPDGDGTGEPVLLHKKPNVGDTFPITTPPDSRRIQPRKARRAMAVARQTATLPGRCLFRQKACFENELGPAIPMATKIFGTFRTCCCKNSRPKNLSRLQKLG